jgi:ankyrin repeat protein
MNLILKSVVSAIEWTILYGVAFFVCRAINVFIPAIGSEVFWLGLVAWYFVSDLFRPGLNTIPIVGELLNLLSPPPGAPTAAEKQEKSSHRDEDAVTTSLDSDLHAAVREGDLRRTIELLTAGVNPNLTLPDRTTPLHLAAAEGHREMVELLLGRGANVEARSSLGLTPIMFACANGNLEAATLLLNCGADATARADNGASVVDACIQEQTDEEFLHLLLTHGAQATVKDQANFSSLHLCAAVGIAAHAAILLDHGGDVSGKDNSGATPLHAAAVTGNYGVASCLLERGANSNDRDSAGRTPLHVAVVQSHAKEDTDKFKQFKRVERRFEELFTLLLDKGADLNAIDNRKNTPLVLAAENGSIALVRAILERGGSPNSKNIEGYSPLHIAARIGNRDVVKLLVVAGAEIEAMSPKGTPFHVAKNHGHDDVVALLIALGANAKASAEPIAGDIGVGLLFLALGLGMGYFHLVKSAYAGNAVFIGMIELGIILYGAYRFGKGVDRMGRVKKHSDAGPGTNGNEREDSSHNQ